MNAVRTVGDMQRVFAVQRAERHRGARRRRTRWPLVEKIIHDLDRPKAEVVVDIIVMETSTDYSRQLGRGADAHRA